MTRIIATLIFIIPMLAFANAVTVYRWIDKNKVVHFSQNQPTDNEFVELNLTNPSARNEQPSPQVEDKASSSTKTTDISDVTSLCENATANLKTLTSFEKVQYTDGNGKIKMLSDEQKTQQIDLSKKQIAIYCKKP